MNTHQRTFYGWITQPSGAYEPENEPPQEPDTWMLYSDHQAAITTLQQEVEAYKRAKQENDDRFMRERDEARQEIETLRAEMHCMQDGALVRDLKARLARHEEAAPQVVDPSGFSMGDPHPCDVSRAQPAPQDGETKP